MDTEHGPASREGSTPSPQWSAQAQGTPPPPPPPYPGWAGYGWQPYPAGQGDTGHAHPARRNRAMKLIATGAAAAIVAGGSAWAATGHGSGALSADTIAARTNPGLVDVISTLGYQRGTAEGTGMVLTATGEVLTNNHVITGATADQGPRRGQRPHLHGQCRRLQRQQ